jgi:AraC-like DNA-binding protein
VDVVIERIPSDSARWLARQVHSMGFPLERILAGTGLTESWMNDEDALVGRGQYLSIVANSLSLTDDPGLGLSLGSRQYLGELGFLGYAIISSPTLRDASEAALRFWELNGSLVTLSFREGDRFHTWDIQPAFPMSSTGVWVYAVEELLSAFYTAASFLSNQGFRYARILLSYPEPPHGSRYREIFGCPVLFGAGVDQFHVDAAYSDRPTFTGHPQMALICQQQCQLLQAKLRGSDKLVSTIREIIVSSLGQLPHLPEVAARMAMSPRTLRRRLQERETTYQHILDEVRIELAKEYVSTTHLSVDQIAGRIGFTEATTFRRAFKKWTGMNVKEYRLMNRYAGSGRSDPHLAAQASSRGHAPASGHAGQPS